MLFARNLKASGSVTNAMRLLRRRIGDYNASLGQFEDDDAGYEPTSGQVPDPANIVLDNVSKSAGQGRRKRLIFQALNATFERGHFVGILGGKGSGKTALVNILTGNERPDGGRISHSMSVSWPISSREVFNKTLSVRSNVRFLAEMYGGWPPGILDAVIEIGRLRRVDLDKPIREVADEVHNRASASLAFALSFDCYVADELICRGSRQFREYMIDLFESRRGKHSLIVATKNLQLVRDICDQCYLLEDGTLKSYHRKGDAIRAFKSVRTGGEDAEILSDDADEVRGPF